MLELVAELQHHAEFILYTHHSDYKALCQVDTVTRYKPDSINVPLSFAAIAFLPIME